MLEKIIIEEEPLVENGKLYAYCFRGATKRELDPCEYRKFVQKQIMDLEEEKKSLEERLEEVTKKMTEARKVDNQLLALGYCLVETPVYKKIDGIVQRDKDGNAIVETYTHAQSCPNYREG